MDAPFLLSVGSPWEAKDFPTDLVVLDEHREAVNRVVGFLTRRNARSVVVSGESGVGKSTLIHLVCQELKKDGWFILQAGSSDLLAGQRYIGDLEQQVKTLAQNMMERKKNLWVIPNFHELEHAGKHQYSHVSILDMLLPHLEKGKLKILGETEPRHYEKVVQSKPSLPVSIETVRLEPKSQEETLQMAATWIESQGDKPSWAKAGPELLEEAALLSKQYLGNKQEPGNLFDFLKLTRKYNLAATPQGKEPEAIESRHLISSLSSLTGLPASILDDAQRLDLHGLRDHFRTRVMGQEEAVNILIERIAMIKAGLTDPTRPSGVFLFVGPTGTGKTEIAKTLASFLFGTEERMLRLDMSEFQTADSISRIIGSSSQAHDSEALVDKVRKNPFSVVLLDEFEKAHPSIWDLFLQVFDDGRLSDPKGGTADFRHTIIILTSNLGAAVEARTSIGFNSDTPQFSTTNVDRALEGTFRPEFINRIDRVVNFKPLSRATVRKILKAELRKVLQRRGFRQRRWAVEWEDSAYEFLMERGFSATMGARPMKRAIEQYLLAPLAVAIVDHQFPEGDQFLFVRQSGDRLKVDFVDPDEPGKRWQDRQQEEEAQLEKAGELSLRRIAFEAQGELAEREVLTERFDAILDQVESVEWAERKEDILDLMSEPEFWNREERHGLLGEVEFRDRFEASLDTAASLLERLADQDGKTRLNFPTDIIQRLAGRLLLMEQSLESFDPSVSQYAFIKVWTEPESSAGETVGDSHLFLERIVNMYQSWGRKRKMRLDILHASIEDEGSESVLAVSGFAAFHILLNERGIHVWEEPENDRGAQFSRLRVKVDVVSQPVQPMNEKSPLEYAQDAFRKRESEPLKIVRRYRAKPSPLVRDSVKGWRSGLLNRILGGDWDLVE